jgi:deoxyribonuclease-4
LAAREYPVPHFFHAPYLVSLATPNQDEKQAYILKASKDILVSYLRFGDQIGSAGVIFHTNSHLTYGFAKVLPQIHAALAEILERAQAQTPLLIENCAGEGGKVGSFLEVAAMLEGPGLDKVGVCFDTCHAFAGGCDLASAKAVEAAVQELSSLGLLSRLKAIHANDSQDVLGNNKDRHANIGDGYIGEEGFTALLGSPRFSELPWILEVPGHPEPSGKKSGPDLDNINRLRHLAGLPLVPSP